MADVPASAIVRSLKGVFWLCKHWSDLQNAADQEFALAIRGLDEAVSRLQKIVEQPPSLHCAPGNDVNYSGAQQYNPDFTARATEILRHFKATLIDCEIFLTNNAHFHTDQTNVPQNIVWGASIQTEVSTLQYRVGVQTQQVLLLLSTVSMNGNRYIAEQIPHVARNQNPIHAYQDFSIDAFPISNTLVSKFRQASLRHPPLGFRSPEDFPLDEGFIALSGHLQHSTTLSRAGTSQTAHQYLSLLKAQWILQCMKRLPSFKGLTDGGKRNIDAQCCENVIVAELTRDDLTRWRYEDLARLPANHFLIWDTRPISVLQDPMTASRGEKIIFHTPASCNGHELVVFRVLKDDSGAGVRIVRRLAASNSEIQLAPEPVLVNAFKDKLIPLYALTRFRDEKWSLGLQKSGHTGILPYEFDNKEDLLKLQWALTSYTVVSDFETVDWTIARPWKPRSPCYEASRVQIWLWDPHNGLPQAASAASAKFDSDDRSLVSHLTGQSTMTILQDSETSYVSVSTKSQTRYSNTEVVEATKPYETLIIVYAKIDGGYCYLCLELGGQIDIDPTGCECNKKRNSCRRIVLKSQSGNLTVKRVTAKTTDYEGVPDLNIFARSFRKGQTGHPQLDDKQTVKKITGGHVTLDFPTVAIRQTFNKQFTLARLLRRSIESTDTLLESHAKLVSDKPKGRGNPVDRITAVGRTNAPMSSSSSVRSDRTYQHNRFSSSPSSASVDAQQRPSVADHRHDSAMFSASGSSVPMMMQPSELEDRNSSPTEVNGQSALCYTHRAFPNQQSSNDVWNPDPGGIRTTRSRGSANFLGLAELGASCQPIENSTATNLSLERRH